MPTTKQQRAEKAKAAATEMHARMVAAIESAIKSPREWTDYLQVAVSFHTYSARNQWAIYLQNENATLVAGFKKWQEYGRVVRKGEKAI